MADSQPSKGDIAEDLLESERASSSALNAGEALAVQASYDQFLLGLLHEDVDKTAVNFETSLINGRFDRVGEMLVRAPHGQGNAQRPFE